MRIKTGACRLFGQFLLILIPIYGLFSAIGLGYLSDYQTRMARDELSARIGTLGASMAALLEHSSRDSLDHVSSMLATTLAVQSVTCAELVNSHGGIIAAAPLKSGCGFASREESLSLPLPHTGEQLIIRFSLHAVEEANRNNSRYAAIILAAGMLLVVLACYFGFRFLIGKPLGALINAIQHAERTGEHVDAPISGRNELSQAIDAYNTLQCKVQSEAAQVLEKKDQLVAEVARRKLAEHEAVQARIAAETAMTDAQDAARTAEMANRAKSAFLAMISHELRTPLNSIIGFSYLLQRTLLDVKNREYLTFIQTSSEALLAIINDLLDLSRIEAGKLELEPDECDIRDIVENCIDLLQAKADEKGLEFSRDVSADVPSLVIADPKRLRQLLLNLASNAIKFTHEGVARIIVGFRRLSEDSGVLCIDVRDTGIGISEEFQQHIFDRFSQEQNNERRTHEGTGLGLAICRELVSMMGGTIELNSVVGVGSTFSLAIPVKVPRRLAITARPELLQTAC